MIIRILGDTHGRNNWEAISSTLHWDKFIFVGDYFDTRDEISATEQLHNFKKILDFKRKNKNEVVLLFGNHDYHYLAGVVEQYSGYQSVHRLDFQQEIMEAISEGLLDMCHVHNDYVITHAGITQTWLQSCGYNGEPLEKFINDLFLFKPRKFRFTAGKNYSCYGDDVTQSPIWVRLNSLLQDAVVGYTQIVGHTTQEKILKRENIYLIDTLGTSGEHLVIEDGSIKTQK